MKITIEFEEQDGLSQTLDTMWELANHICKAVKYFPTFTFKAARGVAGTFAVGEYGVSPELNMTLTTIPYAKAQKDRKKG